MKCPGHELLLSWQFYLCQQHVGCHDGHPDLKAMLQMPDVFWRTVFPVLA